MYYYAEVDELGVLCVDQVDVGVQDEHDVRVLADDFPNTIYFEVRKIVNTPKYGHEAGQDPDEPENNPNHAAWSESVLYHDPNADTSWQAYRKAMED